MSAKDIATSRCLRALCLPPVTAAREAREADSLPLNSHGLIIAGETLCQCTGLRVFNLLRRAWRVPRHVPLLKPGRSGSGGLDGIAPLKMLTASEIHVPSTDLVVFFLWQQRRIKPLLLPAPMHQPITHKVTPPHEARQPPSPSTIVLPDCPVNLIKGCAQGYGGQYKHVHTQRQTHKHPGKISHKMHKTFLAAAQREQPSPSARPSPVAAPQHITFRLRSTRLPAKLCPKTALKLRDS